MSSNATLAETFPLLKQDESDLKDLVKKYPWCSVAQLYLLLHYKKNNSIQFEKQAAKTALFFNNKNWLTWQLQLLSKEDEGIQLTEQENILPKNNNTEENNNKLETLVKDTSYKTNTNEKIIDFEPLHTRDYFASQGIKITEEPTTNDKLGNQMKSFTEWLKSMKKIHKENLSSAPSYRENETDRDIQQIAEYSNEDAAIVTEAMAEVLVKQNKTEKAIEVYEKLSLQNPAKSAYFAGKINSLKAS